MKNLSDEELINQAAGFSCGCDKCLARVEPPRMELLARLERGRKAIEAMEKLEWSAVHDYSTGWPCCPLCRGIKPGYGRDKEGRMPASGHKEACYFYAREATDEN